MSSADVLADYGFEYSDDNVEEEDVDIENQYYNSKGQLPFICATLNTNHVQYTSQRGSQFPSSYASNLAILVGLIEESPREASKGFQEVVSMESEKGEW